MRTQAECCGEENVRPRFHDPALTLAQPNGVEDDNVPIMFARVWLCWRCPSRLVATPSEDRLNIRHNATPSDGSVRARPRPARRSARHSDPTAARSRASRRGEVFKQARHRAGGAVGGDQLGAHGGCFPVTLVAGDEDHFARLVGQPVERALDCRLAAAPSRDARARIGQHVRPPILRRRLLRVRPRTVFDCSAGLQHGGHQFANCGKASIEDDEVRCPPGHPSHHLPRNARKPRASPPEPRGSSS
jgi:hypothetical protein